MTIPNGTLFSCKHAQMPLVNGRGFQEDVADTIVTGKEIRHQFENSTIVIRET